MFKRLIFVIVIFLFVFSSLSWARDLEEISNSGYISFGIRKISIAIYQGEDFTNPGFCYEIAKAFAQDLGVKPKFHVVSKFSDYWMKDGVFLLRKKSPNGETPDIYDRVDVVSDVITLTKKRQRFVNMVPFIENKEIFFGRKDLNVRSYEDLRGLRIMTYEGMSFYSLIKKELEKRNILYVINYIVIDKNTGKMTYTDGKKAVNKKEVELLIVPPNQTLTKFSAYYQILLGHADLSLQDSFSFFLHYYETPSFRDGLKPLLPVRAEVGYLSFCTSYKTQRLNEKLKKFMKDFRKSDRFSKLVEKYMGITYKEYKYLLSMEGE